MLNVQVVVFALGPGTQQSDIDQLISAIHQHCHAFQPDRKQDGLSSAANRLFSAPLSRMSPRDAFFAGKEM
jgi:hypothetical protein